MARIDIVIPVFNTPAPYLRQAIESVLGQTFDDWRAIIVNDGSSAECSNEIEALIGSLEEPRIRYLKSGNQGVSAARNLGIANSDSDLVSFLDSDDIWYPDKLAQQVHYLDAHPEISLVHGCIDRLHGDDLSKLSRCTPASQGTNGLNQHDACVRMLRGNFISTTTATVRRNALPVEGPFDASFRAAEDKELWVRLLLAGHRFEHLPIAQAIYRMHATNTSRNAERFFQARMQLIRKVETLINVAPVTLRSIWPALKAEMSRHAYHELAESYMEAGRHALAIRYFMPWHCGLSLRTIRGGAVACLGLIGLRN